MSAAAKIAIFGGSFNPIHRGHVGLVKAAIARLGLDRVIVIPAFVSPFKTGSDERDFFPPDVRLAMVKDAFATMPEVTVDDRELRKGGVSFAIDTVSEIAAENPGVKIYFLIGEDSVAGLPRWKDYDRLCRLCEFVSFPRTAESSTEIRHRLRAGESVTNLMPAGVKAI